jgi:PIN domain nuclease of toxin-antitoxin system
MLHAHDIESHRKLYHCHQDPFDNIVIYHLRLYKSVSDSTYSEDSHVNKLKFSANFTAYGALGTRGKVLYEGD